MTSSNSYLSLFASQRPFALDDFQVSACQHIEEGRGVLVCAPTGSGKTIVGEFAIFLGLRTGGRCFYTTPIKALSNQKYHDLVEMYDKDTIGLLTGDQTINPEAEIVVMTTEVLRNMIYAGSDNLDRLSYVIMDEIHYLADKSRGAVWEEIILNLDPSVSIIGLSATVSNSEEFGEWLRTVRGNTEVIVSTKRPIPLTQYALVGHKLMPLFDAEGDVNPKLRNSALSPKQVNFNTAIDILRQQEKLPAIFFIFSRNGCDKAFYNSKLTLTTKEEYRKIKNFADAAVADIPEEDLRILGYKRWRGILCRGLAAHHAGMLPAFRHIVEKLFEQGLIKVVFATETLALGINMPARTVFLERLVKFNGETHAELSAAQYTQLTGRAGRRGIDTQGNAVIRWQENLDPNFIQNLTTTSTYPLISTFRPSYNMSVNLLKTMGYEKSSQIIERSFAQFQANREIVNVANELDDKRKRLADLDSRLQKGCMELAAAGAIPLDEDADVLGLYEEYMSLREQQREEEDLCRERAIKERRKELRAFLRKVTVGDVLLIPGRRPNNPELCVVVAAGGRAIVLNKAGHRIVIEEDSFLTIPVKVGRIGASLNDSAKLRQLRRGHFPRFRKLANKVQAKKSARLTHIRAKLRQHPVHFWKGRHKIDGIAFQIQSLRKQVARLEAHIEDSANNLSTQFNNYIALMREIDYVDENNQPTDDGLRLARIHNEADLLTSECLRRQIWSGLDPAELAGMVSLCCAEARGDVAVDIALPTEAMNEAFGSTMRIWEEIISNEQRWNLPQTRRPETAMALILHQWTAGAPLEYCLHIANELGLRMTPGDFVRQCRILIDNLEQVRHAAPTIEAADEIRHTASQAIDAIKRGVVEL